YTLGEAQTHGEPGTDTDEELKDTIAVSVKGIGDSQADGELTITIVDDEPVAGKFRAGYVKEDDDDANEVGGNLVDDGDNTFGADGAASDDALTYGAPVATLGGTA